MLIVSARDNENNRLRRKATKSKNRKEQRLETSYSKGVRAKWES